jgi:Leucine-rich repeat (LRR) protein
LSPDDSLMLERYALATLFFASTNLELWEESSSVPTSHWKTQTNWMTSKGFCSWHGVVCVDGVSDGNAKIVALQLPSNDLSGHLAPELRFLSNLDSLDLSNNKIAAHIPTEVATILNLKSLVLNNNQFNGRIPSELGALTLLQTLNLGGNDLTGSLPAAVAGSSMTSLKTLVLDDNRSLNGELPTDMSGWKKQLEVLRLERCSLSGTIPTSFYELTSLIDVRLRSNQFQGSIASSLSSLSNLRESTFERHSMS